MRRRWLGREWRGDRGERIESPVNEYYEAVSERYGVAQVILYSLLLAFVVLSFLSNTGEITYQNLYYFLKDLNASVESVDVLKTDSLSYPTDQSQSFTLYRQGLAVAGNSAVTVFTAGGRQTVSKNIRYQNPTAVGSGKYLLIYDLGGTEYSLYNSYTQIHTGKTAEPIRGAAMSKSGMYAIVTQSSQYPSVVDLFNSDFKQINQYPYNGYVSDVAIHDKGSYVAVLLSEAKNGTFETALRIYEPGAGEIFSSVTVGNGLGLRCGFTASGDVAILCGNGVSYASVRGKLIAEHAFDGKILSAFDMNADGCVAVLKKNQNSSENYTIVFDKSGKVLYNNVINETVDAAALCGEVFYLMTSDGILRVRISDQAISQISCVTEQRVMLAVDRDRVLLCSSKQAVVCLFEN